ncbi:MAG: ABC transporter ATP-binding protein [Xanthobacteraceae bacterium]|nr:MAG: ABC transporter ATP-binding protein [Xanthobacteraceae bacterium]
MSSDEVAIRVRDVSKHYLMFARPEDRLKQMIVPRLQRMIGRPPRRYFKDFAALGGVSFEIRRGETVGIIGRNGSGKSTLLQIVCGTLRPSTGGVEVQGRIAALLELGSGFNPEFTGRENVYINAAILGLSREETDARFEEIARFADIGDFIEQPVKTYSSGMYVRLAFATAINVDPDILVIDEALAVGDEAFQRKCYARLEDIQDKGGTILFVSHGMQSVVQLCSRALLFDGGELLLDGRPKLVTSQYQRLVNASAEAAAAIRQSIRDIAATPMPEPEAVPAPWLTAGSDDPVDAFGAPEPDNIPEMAASPPPSHAAERADYFDPGLVPQSTVYLEERGARIRDVRILTLKGERVNVLTRWRRYVYAYDVEFTEDAENVAFAMYFKTVNGQGLAGATTRHSRIFQRVNARAGTVVTVQVQFICCFSAGMIFCNCGVLGNIKEESAFLHRIIDGIAFRVASDPDVATIGPADFDPIVDIKTASVHAEVV